MHKFLRAIGFSEIKNKSEMNIILEQVLSSNTKAITPISASANLIQINKNFGETFGCSLVGEYDAKGCLNIEHCFPYCIGEFVTSQSDIQIENHADKEAYSGLCDDLNVGMTLIFYLQNISDYVKSKWINEFYKIPTKVVLSGLSTSGKILLDIGGEDVSPKQKKINEAGYNSRKNLLAKAKAGDFDALESLTLEDMDMYTLISKRMKNEDVLSIVKSYFMPFGIDNEQYSILGYIISVQKTVNILTKEIVCNLAIECNDILFNVCINSIDLVGEPVAGRRFKGNIWLQGNVTFD